MKLASALWQRQYRVVVACRLFVKTEARCAGPSLSVSFFPLSFSSNKRKGERQIRTPVCAFVLCVRAGDGENG
ncbi:hypothetical protein V5799_024321 [Amblyomma americanum]|uniref:Uncharacterized protein n=1 Tax=Amblyomma americanum TaxID=6943 RepID=A0AAQ4ECE9_AMBAM